MTLQSFPRGGKKPGDKPQELHLFKSAKPKKRERSQPQETPIIEEETNLIANTAERLSRTTLCEGLVVLGCVQEATDCELIVSLPGGILGQVQVTEISASYTSALQNVIKSEDGELSDFKTLPELYQPGDYIVCLAKSVQGTEKKDINLSINPKLVNQNITVAHLVKGLRIVCMVTSVEDHGCVVDTGIPNVRAFVPSKGLDNRTPLYPGKQVFCSIKELTQAENACTLQLYATEKYARATCSIEITAIDALTPGTKLQLTIRKVLSNGLRVQFGDDHTGYVNQLYLPQALSTYNKGASVTGMLLYIIPTFKFGYFTLLVDKPKEPTFRLGDIVSGAIYQYRDANGLIMKLNEHEERGFVGLRRTGVDFEKINSIKPGTRHRCRVLLYNRIERIYMCTMERHLLQQRYFSLADLKPGDITTVTVKSINPTSNFVNVFVEKLMGYVAPEHISDAGLSGLEQLRPGVEVEARVLGTDTERQRLKFTLKESLIHSKLPILTDIAQAQAGDKYHGTIVQITKNGLLVRFFEDAKGFVACTVLDRRAAGVKWNYSVGQTVLVKVDRVNVASGKMHLVIGGGKDKPRVVKEEEPPEETPFEIGESVEGTITDSSVDGVYVRISKPDGSHVSTAYLPAGHMSPDMETAALLASRCIPGDKISGLIFAVSPILTLTRTFVPQENVRDFTTLKVGQTLPCCIKDITPDGVRVILPLKNYSKLAYVRFTHISNFPLLHENQLIFGKVTSIAYKDKEVGLTALLKRMLEDIVDPKEKMMPAVEVLRLYFSKTAELSKGSHYQNNPLSKVSLGERVSGEVLTKTADGLVVQLENNARGIVRKHNYTGDLEVGDKVTGTILWINYAHEYADLTLLPLVMNSIHGKQSKIPKLPIGNVLRGEIVMVTNWFVLIVVKGNKKGCLAALPARRHTNDLQPDLRPYTVGARIRCYAVLNKSETNLLPICILKSAFEASKLSGSISMEKKTKSKRKQGPETEQVPAKKSKRIKTEIQPDEAPAEETKTKIPKAKRKLKDTTTEEPETKTDTVQEEQKPKSKVPKPEKIESFRTIIKPKDITKKSRIPECGFSWDSVDPTDKPIDSSSDSEEESEQPKQKKKKLNAAERREQERQKEREIREREEALASNQLPNSVDQFDRLVLASPDSSLIWLQYMAYHLQATEIEKARAVARRAIKSISFREESEKLNVWNAWLNLESKFGTPETLNDVFQEAVRTNDAAKVYTHMLTVFAESGRQQELEKTVSTMLGKFKQEPEVWIECGTALLKSGLKEKSRHIMQRALQSLPAAEHVNLLVRFANLENKLGDKERSQTLFEQILSSYPKRVDVWSSYVDALVKSGDPDLARRVLERAVVQTLPPRKMRSLFKKFIAFEEQHGDAEAVARVKGLAADYVEKQCNKFDD